MRSGVHFPITSGSHTLLPSKPHRILIWGDLPLTITAEKWLRSHHYSDIVVPPWNSHQALDREAILTLATELQAEFVLLLEQEELKTGALIEPHCRTGFNINVTVRGLSQVSRESVFRGNAHYPHCIEHTQEVFEKLTCQALATAWGFRPSGQLEIPSSLACTTGQLPYSTVR